MSSKDSLTLSVFINEYYLNYEPDIEIIVIQEHLLCVYML